MSSLTPPLGGPNVTVYSNGVCHASVCAPAGMAVDDVLDEVNRVNPTGLDHGWMISAKETFRTGEANPCPCEQDPSRVHRLLDC